jgi:multidrug transporter EmrE-like cation transporter
VRASLAFIWTLNVLASLAYAVGAIFMKASDGYARPWPSFLVYVCFGVGATCQVFAMRFQDVGSGYTIVLGLEAVAAIGLGILLFREPLTLMRATGIALVLGGVVLLRH